jgi:hypothetical protein
LRQQRRWKGKVTDPTFIITQTPDLLRLDRERKKMDR